MLVHTKKDSDTKPLRFLDFLDYEAFMARLRAREQQGRSLRILVNPIDPFIEASYAYAHLPHSYVGYTTKLVKKLQAIRDRLVNRPEWPHHNRKITDEELKSASDRISLNAVAQLSLTNPWPTREMSGVEVLVEDTFPFDRKRFFPIPIPNSTITLPTRQRLPTKTTRQHFIILWITGENKSNEMDQIIREIMNSPAFLPLTSKIDVKHDLKIFMTINQVKNWIEKHQSLTNRPDILIKVVTGWKLNQNQTAVDAIRTVRSQLSHAPFLIFTNRLRDIRSALEFPNVMVTYDAFEVKEFIGIKQETQWGLGYKVSSKKKEKKGKRKDHFICQ